MLRSSRCCDDEVSFGEGGSAAVGGVWGRGVEVRAGEGTSEVGDSSFTHLHRILHTHRGGLLASLFLSVVDDFLSHTQAECGFLRDYWLDY